MAASRLGGTCPACEHGRVWLSPDGNPIRFCHKHERLVSAEPGWMVDGGRVTVEIGTCAAGYCDRPAVTYLAGGGDRRTFIVGPRADFLAHTGPAEIAGVLSLRCLDCAHHELDRLLISASALTSGRIPSDG